MKLFKHIGLPLLTIVVASQAIGAQVDNRELCMQLEEFAHDVPLGTSRYVQVSIGQQVGAVRGLECRPVPMDKPGLSLCRYLVEHTSREALTGNIRRLMSCVDGSKLSNDKNRNLLWHSFIGRLTASGPFAAYPNVDVELEYSSEPQARRTDFMRVTATGVSNTD